jgi:hypothetical protein
MKKCWNDYELIKMIGVVVDIDDTLVDTDKRRWKVWCKILNREIPLETIRSLGSRQILERFAFSNKDIWKEYWGILLCWNESGSDIIELDKPIPFASQVLQKWNEEYKIIYLTGRSQNMRDLTLNELKKFNFPTENVDLVMISQKGWERYFAFKTTPTKLRARLFSSIIKRYKIFRVIDDYPVYFPIYKQFKILDRIGLLREKRFSPQDYLSQGATRVTIWEKLLNEHNK